MSEVHTFVDINHNDEYSELKYILQRTRQTLFPIGHSDKYFFETQKS